MEVGGRDGPCNVTSGRPHDGPFLRVSRHSVTSLVATPLDPSVSPLGVFPPVILLAERTRPVGER